MSTRKYNLNTKKENVDSINLICITSSICENDWISAPHSHSFAEIFYEKNGEGIMYIENKEFALKKK